ncbi:MAG: hypothetical protein WBK76_02805 [Candidatus Saccharimonadales bacterium]
MGNGSFSLYPQAPTTRLIEETVIIEEEFDDAGNLIKKTTSRTKVVYEQGQRYTITNGSSITNMAHP